MLNLDLKDLAIIEELCRTSSVTETASNLGVSQPTISVCLGRLRKHFGDPFFVRTSAGMVPTPVAEGSIKKLSEAYFSIREALNPPAAFNPGTSERIFDISVTDIGQATLLPGLLKYLGKAAPGVRVHVRLISETTPRMLETGKTDLAVAFIPDPSGRFYQQKLFAEHFVCAVRVGHPRLKHKLTMRRFQDESHVVVNTPGTGHATILHNALKEQRISQPVGLTVASYLGLSVILVNTDYLATVPERYGKILARAGDIALLSLPFEVPTFIVRQLWHERYGHDSGNKWLRTVMANLFLN